MLLFLEMNHNDLREYKQRIYKDMEICSLTLKCPKYQIDFKAKKRSKLHVLYENEGLYAYFRVPKSKKFNLKLIYSKANYQKDRDAIRLHLFMEFLAGTLLLFIVVFFLTIYSLRPIRQALQINDEFIKDILHDFNTPITSMVLNLSMLDKQEQVNPFIKRVNQGLDTIVLLQNNLKSFLASSALQSELVDITQLAQERLVFMKTVYPAISFRFVNEQNLVKITNRELLIRILDNLLSNASKYNRQGGWIELKVKEDQLTILDTGKGIKDVKRVLERYVTEQERGLGIGLHVVNKLNQELGIKMTIESEVGRGTKVILDFSGLKGGV